MLKGNESACNVSITSQNLKAILESAEYFDFIDFFQLIDQRINHSYICKILQHNQFLQFTTLNSLICLQMMFFVVIICYIDTLRNMLKLLCFKFTALYS